MLSLWNKDQQLSWGGDGDIPGGRRLGGDGRRGSGATTETLRPSFLRARGRESVIGRTDRTDSPII